MNTSLALIQPSEFDLMSKLAKVAADSGYSGKNANQCLFVLLKGYELGISPFAALDGIQIIQGKPTVSPQLMLAMINRSGFLEDMTIESSATQCTVMMKRKGRSPHTETFTMNDAQAMQLAGKDNWKKQPATMLKWRAVSACARVVFPDVLMSVYTPEEMGADVSMSDDGEMTVITPAAPVIDVQPQVPALPENVIEYQDAHVDTETGEKIVVDTDAAKQALGTPSGQRVETGDPLPTAPTLQPANVVKVAVKRTGQGEGKILTLALDNGLYLKERSRQLFIQAGWITDNAWKDEGEYTMPNAIPVMLKRDKTGKGWELASVPERPNPFIQDKAG